MNRPRLILLGSAAGLLVLAALGEWWAGEAQLSRIDAPAAAARARAARPATVADLGAEPEQVQAWLQTALGRPLMTQSRRPAASGPSSGIALSNGLPRLAGTLIKSDGPVAIFARDDAGHAVVARQGETVGPYRIARIEPGSVVVDGPEGQQTLHPKFSDSAAAITPPVAPGFLPQVNMPGTVPPGIPQPMFQRDSDQRDSD